VFDPISLAAGAGILAAGFLAGRLGRHKPAAPTQPQAVCGCVHSLAHHDPETGFCHGTTTLGSRSAGWRYVPCTCRQYVGPKPIEDLFAPQYLPPAE
jgi:hypothetical protein